MTRVSLGVIAALSLAGQELVTQQSPLDRIISAPVPIEVTMESSRAGDMVRTRLGIVSRLTQIPTGFEEATDPPRDSPRSQTVDLRGMTVRQALDALVAADPRYEWREASGVAVVRSKTSWADCTHFLNREVTFERREMTLASALRTFQRLIDPAFGKGARERPLPEPLGPEVKFSLELSKGTVLEVFNTAAARAPLSWKIAYGEIESEKRSITVSVESLDGSSRMGEASLLRPMPATCHR